MDRSLPETSGPRPWTIRRLMKQIAGLALGLGAITWGMRLTGLGPYRPPPRAWQCLNNLRQIGLALAAYANDHGCYPPAYVADANGRPMHSWRVLILPYLDNQALYNDYNFAQPWDGPDNRSIGEMSISQYGCRHDAGRSDRETNYAVLTGPGTLFPGTKTVRPWKVPDGLARTLMVTETTSVRIPWTAPIDLDIRTLSGRLDDPGRPSISARHPDGPYVVFGDGSVMQLRKDLAPSTLRALITINGGETINTTELWP